MCVCRKLVRNRFNTAVSLNVIHEAKRFVYYIAVCVLYHVYFIALLVRVSIESTLSQERNPLKCMCLHEMNSPCSCIVVLIKGEEHGRYRWEFAESHF